MRNELRRQPLNDTGEGPKLTERCAVVNVAAHSNRMLGGQEPAIPTKTAVRVGSNVRARSDKPRHDFVRAS